MIAKNRGIEIKIPTSGNENQMRLLQKRLRNHGIRWVREPNWNQPQHDLAVVDFRLAVERSIQCMTNLSLMAWISESAFRANTDVIDFKFIGKNGEKKHKKKGVCPDGFFIVADEIKKKNSEDYKARFLLEMDMATHDNPSFGIEKAAAGAAYIISDAYKNRFGANAGGWLVVTTGETRMKNLIKQTKYRVKDHNLFYFTTLEHIETTNILAAPIWWQVNKSEPQALPFSLG